MLMFRAITVSYLLQTPVFALSNSLVQSLCIVRYPEAFRFTLFSSTIPDSSLFMKILQEFIDAKSEKQGRLIHNLIITYGLGSDTHLGTKLVIFYSKSGDMATARKVFDKMPVRNIVSWTAIVSGYCHNGLYDDAFLVFVEMHRAGVKGNQFTYGSLLSACTGLRCMSRGLQVQGCIQKRRLSENIFVQSALVDLHSKCGKMKDASCIFEMMLEKDVVSWNTMIGGYAVQGFANESFQMFRLMLREGKIPDCFTLSSALRAFTGGGGLATVSQIHALIVQLGFGSYSMLTGSLIDAYAKSGNIGIAHKLYKCMPNRDLISCSTLVAGYAREGNHTGNAFDLFKEISLMKMGFDNVILCSMLNISANIASLSLGRQIHALALKCQANHDVAMSNALIHMYAKSGEIANAHRVFDEMAEKNVISWTSLIAGYGKHGYGHEAIALYEKMESEGLKPNDVTFLSLLFVCSHTGLTGKGQELFHNMVRKYNIIPREEHLSCMIDLFARGGHLEEAYKLIDKMDIKTNASLWGAILGACSIYGNVSLGERAATHLFSINPEKSANYVVLANIYAAAGAWDNAQRTWKLMEDRSLRKNPGYSLIQSKKKKIALLEPS